MNVYADHAATTPMRACAKEAMLEALEDFGNPSSIHSAGRLAAVRLESARKEVAELLNCRPLKSISPPAERRRTTGQSGRQGTGTATWWPLPLNTTP